MDKGFLMIGNKNYPLEEANIYAIYDSSFDSINWHIEIFPNGEDNYIMFNGIDFGKLYLLESLNNLKYKTSSDNDDLYEHTVYVDGNERFLESVSIEFKELKKDEPSITIVGSGKISSDGNDKDIEYSFQAICIYKGLNIYETTEAEVEDFINKKLKVSKDKLDLNYENVPSGKKCTITEK